MVVIFNIASRGKQRYPGHCVWIGLIINHSPDFLKNILRSVAPLCSLNMRGLKKMSTPSIGNRRSSSLRPNFLVSILITVLFVASTVVSPALGQAGVSAPQAAVCQPGTGWKWTSGTSQPDVAIKAQQALNQAGITAVVSASTFGEIDSCGTFMPTAMDFALTFVNQASLSATGQQQLSAQIYPVLKPFGKPALGNVKVRLSASGMPGWSDQTISLTPPASAGQSMESTASSGQLAFVSLSGNDTLSVINTQDNSIIKSGISVGSSPSDMAFSPNGERLYVNNGGEASVSVIDTFSYLVIATIPVGTYPRGIAVSKDGSRVYVSNNGSQTLSIIDAGSLTVVKTIPLAAHPEEIALSPDGHRLFIAATVPLSGLILDTTSETLTGSFDFNAGNGIAITPDGAHAYITNWEGTVTVIDLATMLPIKTIPVGSTPHRVTISSDGKHAYVANFGSNDVSVIDISSNTVVATIPVNSTPWAMDLVDDNSRLYVPTSSEGIAVVDTATHAVVQQIPTGSAASSVAIFHGPPGAVHKKVYVVVYDPLLSGGENLSTHLGWNSYAALDQGTISLFKQASQNYLLYDVVDTKIVTDGWPEKIDGFRYTETQYLDAVSGKSPYHSPDAVNYNKIVNDPQLDICGKANRGEIDEVWIFNGPGFGFYESSLVGPGAYWYNSPPVPGPFTCNRLIPLMGPSPERGVAEEVHNFGHRNESTMQEVYGSWNENSIAHSWDKFALDKYQSPSFSYSGCGNVHFPANGTSDYDYGNPATVQSNCADFANYPQLHNPASVLQPVTCSLWGCDHQKYLGYWFSALPNSTGCGPDNVANNWWKYFANPTLALNPASICQPVTASLSLNFPNGSPGSFFTLAGANYPPHASAALSINGSSLGSTTTDSSGSLLFVLDTAASDAGGYLVTVTINLGSSGSLSPSAASSLSRLFTLAPGAPLRPQINQGELVTIPVGIAFTPYIASLPLIKR
jgi:YVTN family beta-propeller protein